MNSRKPIATMPWTEITREIMVSGRFRLNAATAAPHADSNRAHSSSDPSWAPQIAETL